jgi:hypothetical protein
LKPTGAVLVASLLLVAAAPCRCDEPSIAADRPGFGESASVVPLHRLQVETGAAFTWLGDGATVLDGPEALFRLGLPGPLEFRVAAPNWLRARDSGSTATTTMDTFLRPRTQLDLSNGVLISRAPTACFVGAGFYHRF